MFAASGRLRRPLPSRNLSMRAACIMRPPYTHKAGLFLVFLTAIVACGSRADLVPSGTISLEYVETSGERAVFQLENRSTQSLYFRGRSTPLTGVAPLAGAVSTLQCKPAEAGAWVVEGKIEEGGPETIHVAPGQRQRLSVQAAFAQQYKGGRCRLRLRLEGGTFIESRTFTP